MTDELDSPAVAAVRKVRQEMAEECEYDVRKLIDLLRREEEKAQMAGFRFAQPRDLARG